MKRITLIALALLAPMLAHGASFDCNKAATKIEILICSDTELTRLDEEMSTAYKAALQDEKHADSIKDSQQTWIKGRGLCLGAQDDTDRLRCLKLTYRRRLPGLKFPFLDAAPASKPVGLYLDTATLLHDGKVLFWNGSHGQLYDPAINRFSTTSDPVYPFRDVRYPAAIPLPGGMVLVAGGTRFPAETDIQDPDLPVRIRDAMLYSPETGTFKATGKLPTANPGTVTLLANGKVLIAGGYTPARGGDPRYLRDAWLYDPLTGKSAATGSLITERSNHSATLLQNGKVLIVGGSQGQQPTNAEIYDPTTGQFTATGSPLLNRSYHSATLLPDGRVLVVGGRHSDDPNWPYEKSYDTQDSAELYDPATGRFTATGKPVAGGGKFLLLLPNGKVLLWGELEGAGCLELYDPASGAFSPVGQFPGFTDALLLKNGKLLLFVGEGAKGGLYDLAAVSK